MCIDSVRLHIRGIGTKLNIFFNNPRKLLQSAFRISVVANYIIVGLEVALSTAYKEPYFPTLLNCYPRFKIFNLSIPYPPLPSQFSLEQLKRLGDAFNKSPIAQSFQKPMIIAFAIMLVSGFALAFYIVGSKVSSMRGRQVERIA